ncbi:MAG: MlaD family protein [Treponema sp.]|nr:MlaD family protein [Treponema sp.]
MKFSIKFADQIVGALVVLGIAILIFVIFMLGRNQRWFVQDYQYITYLSSASGLSRNMPVQYKGFTIGNVKDFKLAEADDKEDDVIVYFTIYNEYAKRVTIGSLVELQSSPIPGLGNSFQFYFGKGTEEIPQGNTIPEVRSMHARFLITAGLTNIPATNDTIGNIIDQVNELLETIIISLAGYDGSETLALGQIVNNIEVVTSDFSTITRDLGLLSQTISRQLNPVIHNIESITGRISDPSGAFMGILDGDGAFFTNIESSITSLASIIDNLDRTTEALPDFLPSQLPQVGVFIGELNSAIRSLQDVLTAVSNNPLLRGGIPQQTDTTPGGASPRNIEF